MAPSRVQEQSAETFSEPLDDAICVNPPGEQITQADSLPPSLGIATLALNSLPASRFFHRSTTSNKLFPSEKSAASVVIGYHATYPAPRTAVNAALIWSQLVCFAIPSGTPTCASRVVSSAITPS